MSINAYNASTISALFAGLNNSSSGTSLSYGIDFTTYNSCLLYTSDAADEL